MEFSPCQPRGGIAADVETIFHLKGYCPDHSIERVVPDGSGNLIIELDGQNRWVADNVTHDPIQTCQHSWLSGPHRNYFSISAVPETELIGIRFRPGGLFALLGQTVGDYVERIVDGSKVFGASIIALRKCLVDKLPIEEKLDLVEQWLTKERQTDHSVPRCVEYAIEQLTVTPSLRTIGNLVDQSGYSRKHFLHLFKKHVGLGPKELQRILRFSSALAQIQESKSLSWAAISIDCGYADQAHFIKDFKAFSGVNPSRFLDMQHGRMNFFPIN